MPTRAGVFVLLVGLAMLVAGFVFGPITLVVAGCGAIATFALSMLVRLALPSRLAVGRTVSPARVPTGDSARIDLHLANRARRRSPMVRIHDAVSGTGGVRLSMAPIDAGATGVGAYRVPAVRRGVVEVGPVEIVDIDAFGLARRRHRVDSRARVIVHPPLEPLAPTRAPTGDDPILGDELRRALGLTDDEFDGLREYEPGDDLRRIHWPSSARHDDLLVRQFRPPRHGRLSVVIDTRGDGGHAEVLDATTSVGASIAAAVLRAGDAARIETTDGRRTALLTGDAGLDAALEFCALLEGGADELHGSVPVGGGSVVAVSGDPRIAADPGARRRLAQRLRARVVVTVTAANWADHDVEPAGRADADPGASPAGGNDWIHLGGPGQLAEQWARIIRPGVPAP